MGLVPERVVLRYLRAIQEDDDEEPDEVLFPDDLTRMSPERRAAWKGYHYELVTSAYTPEEVSNGDDEALDTRNEKGSAHALVEVVEKFGGKDRWPKPHDGWYFGKGKKDRKGGFTNHALQIERVDGRLLNYEERTFLARQLKITG